MYLVALIIFLSNGDSHRVHGWYPNQDQDWRDILSDKLPNIELDGVITVMRSVGGINNPWELIYAKGIDIKINPS